MTRLAQLSSRCVLAVTGADRVGFLNGLVSNDMEDVVGGRCVWTALLTAQGKWLADFFVFADGETLLLDVEATQAPMIMQKLLRFRLRAAVAIEPSPNQVYVAWDTQSGFDLDLADVVRAPDPRLPGMGWRVLTDTAIETNADAADWDLHRLTLGLPDGSSDLEAEKTVLLEAGFDELHGISWTKGCYMGQELTARTRYRGLVKRRLMQVRGASPLPPSGTLVMAGEREVGQLRSSRDGVGLAVLRIDAIDASCEAAGVKLHIVLPAWARLPQNA